MLDAEPLALPRLISRMFGDPLEPSLLAHYELLGELGRGGMGVVHLARDRALDRKVAIKRMTRRQQPELRARFEREAKAMAKLAHPNVVQIYEIDQSEGTTYIVMEYVEGETLREWLTTPRSRDEILDTFIAAGRGLAAVHEAGIVHRDFKPDNVMVRADGRVLVMDFGLAGGDTPAESAKPENGGSGRELTSTGMVMGTPVYMSPEQWQGARVDAKADQFSFCIALWEALHGERPFDDSSRETLEQATTSGALRKPKRAVPQWIQQVLERGLAVEPKRRFGSMQALLDDLGSNPVARVWRISGLVVGIVVLTWLAWAFIAKSEENERARESKQELRKIEDAARAIVERELGRGGIATLVQAIELVSRFGPQAADDLGPEFASAPAVVNDALLHAMAADELWGTRLELIGHEGRVLDVAWSPDGRWLATGGEDRTLRVWDADTGAPRHMWELGGSVRKIEFAPDGMYVVAWAEDERVSIWSTESGRIIQEIDNCSAFTVTPDGEIVTAGTDGMLRAGLPGLDRPRLEFADYQGDEVRVIASSPDKRVATGGDADVARLWDLATGQLLREMPHGDAVTAVDFSHDGGLLATASGDGAASVWRTDTGELVLEVDQQRRYVTSLDISLDERLLVTYHGVAELWDIRARQLLQSFRGDIVDATFSTDGRAVLTATHSGAMIWSAATGAMLQAVDAGHMAYGAQVRYSPDNRSIALVGDQGKAEIWTRVKGPMQHRLQLRQSNGQAIQFAAISHNGRLVAAASINEAWIWDASDGELLEQWNGLAHPIIGITPAYDEQFWLITSSSGVADFGGFIIDGDSEGEIVEVWDLASRRRVLDLTGYAHQPTVRASRTNDTRFTLSTFQSEATITRKGEPGVNFDTFDFFGEFVLSHDGSLGLMSDLTGVWLLNTHTGSKLYQLHDNPGSVLAFSPDGRLAAVQTKKGRITIWDVATGDLVQQLSGPAHMLAMGFAHGGDELLTITTDGALERHVVDPLLDACQLIAGTTQYGDVAHSCAIARVSAGRSHGVPPVDVDAPARLTNVGLWLVLAGLHVLVPAFLLLIGGAAQLRNWAGEHRMRQLLVTIALLAPCMLVSILGRDHGSTPPEMLASELVIFTTMTALSCHGLLWLVRHQPRHWWLWLGLALGVSISLALFWDPLRVVVLLDRPGALLPPALALVIYPLADLAGSEASTGFQAHLDAHADGHHALLALLGFGLALILGLWLVHRIWLASVARFGHRFGFERTNLVTLPLLLAAINLVGLALVPPAVFGLRWLEHEADRVALDATHDNLGCAMAVTLESRAHEDLPPYRRWDPKQLTTAERIDFCNTYRPWEPEQPPFYRLALEVAEELASTSVAR